MQVKSYKAGNVGEVEFDESAFGGKVLYRTLKDAVVMHMARNIRVMATLMPTCTSDTP